MTAIEKRLDDLWQRAVKLRDHHRCRNCYGNGTDAHHIIHRNNMATRWDIDNGRTLCRECHNLAHNGKLLFIISPELQKKGRKVKKWTQEELLGISEELKAYIKQREATYGEGLHRD